MKEPVYLDNHTVAPPSSAAVEAMLPFYRDMWGSPFAHHQKGQELFAPIDQAASQAYEAIGANFEDQLILASSGSDAIRQLLSSVYVSDTSESGRNHFLTPASEDPSILQELKRLQELDCLVKFLPVDSCGRLRPETLEAEIKPRAAMLSISWANPFTGVIQPIADISRICQAKGIHLHVDVSAAIGKFFFHFEGLNIDYLTFNAAAFHAPQGIGGLFCRKASALKNTSSFMHAGHLAALSVAISEAIGNFDHMCTETARLRDKLETGIQKAFPEARIFFQEADRLPNTAVIAFPGVHREALLYAMNRRGIYASTQKIEQALVAIGIDPSLAASSISLSLSSRTQEEEIDRAIDIIADSAHKLRIITGEFV